MHELDGVSWRDDVVALSVDHAYRDRKHARGSLLAGLQRDGVDIRIGAGSEHFECGHGARCGPAGNARMHADGREQFDEAQAQHRGKATARGHADQEHAPRMRAIDAAYGAHLRGDDRRLAFPCRGALIEPVPATPGICVPRLTRQKDQPVALVSEGGDARPGCDFFGRLPAAVEQHDKRPSPPARVTARNVYQILSRRPHPGRDGNPAAPRELASRLEAARLRRRATKEPREEIACTRPERRLRRTRVDHRSWKIFVGPNSFGPQPIIVPPRANEFAPTLPGCVETVALKAQIRMTSYCSCVYSVSTSSEIGLPMKSPSWARLSDSSSRNKSITDCEARMRNSRALNCLASRTISRRIS